jgi:diadenosine tetraphosphate (Ap4A) HIT family hydrolase
VCVPDDDGLVDDCLICARGTPLHVIAEAPTIWVTAPPDAPLPGYVCVVSKRHVVEPFELDTQGSVAFWSACMSTARAVRDVVGAPKVHYEIHGNTIAHLHMHIYPRYPQDPFEGRPIDGSTVNFHRSGEQLQALATGIAAVL